MARKKSGSGEGGAAPALARMKTLATYVAACDDEGLRGAFDALTGGEALYGIFITAVNDEIESLFDTSGSVEDEVSSVTASLTEAAAHLEVLADTIHSLSNERLFSVLNVVTRNFGGTPIPPPSAQAPAPRPVTPRPAAQEAPVPTPVAVEAAPAKKTLKKKFAATSAKDAPTAGAVVPVSSGPPATSMPPRGNRITGLF